MKKVKKLLKRKDVAIFLSVVLVVLFTLFTIKMVGNIGNDMVKIETSRGDIVIALDRDVAPVTVENFLSYVDEGYYDGLVFHRVIEGFMIQGGGYAANGEEKRTREAIELESDNGLKNDKYTIAMARTAIPNSATSQFFINIADNDFLNYASPANPGYAVFGKVVSGEDVVDEIAGVETSVKRGMADWPVEDVVIVKINLV